LRQLSTLGSDREYSDRRKIVLHSTITYRPNKPNTILKARRFANDHSAFITVRAMALERLQWPWNGNGLPQKIDNGENKFFRPTQNCGAFLSIYSNPFQGQCGFFFLRPPSEKCNFFMQIRRLAKSKRTVSRWVVRLLQAFHAHSRVPSCLRGSPSA
jgi:hypothetical protein